MEQLPKAKAGLTPPGAKGCKKVPPWDPLGGLEEEKVPFRVTFAGTLSTLLALLMHWENWAAWESPGLPAHHSYSLRLFFFLDHRIQMSVGTAQPHLLSLSVLTRNNCFPAGELLPLPVYCRENTAWLT